MKDVAKEEFQENCSKNQNFGKKSKNFLIKLGHAMIDLLYPPDIKCIFCGDDVPDFDNQPFCENCAKKQPFNDGNRCKICDVQVPDDVEICDRCKSKKNPILFQKAFCAFRYTDTVRSSILAFKDDNAKYLAPIFSKFICKKINDAGVTVDVIVPVPAHISSIRKRGYNQAELLANQIGKDLGVVVDIENIVKINKNKPQKTLNFEERQKNVYNTLSIKDENKFNGKNVLIVDDIMTTCATVNAVAALIYKSANNVYVATIARRDIRDSKHKDDKHKDDKLKEIVINN